MASIKIYALWKPDIIQKMKKGKTDCLLHVYNFAYVHDLLKYVYVHVIFIPFFLNYDPVQISDLCKTFMQAQERISQEIGNRERGENTKIGIYPEKGKKSYKHRSQNVLVIFAGTDLVAFVIS